MIIDCKSDRGAYLTFNQIFKPSYALIGVNVNLLAVYIIVV